MKVASQPVSIRLDPELRRKAAAFARRRKVGLTTALRMIISEHFDAAEAAADLDAALKWQVERAWSALERWERGEAGEVTLEDLREAHRDALTRARRR
jgi:hypothetical protein